MAEIQQTSFYFTVFYFMSEFCRPLFLNAIDDLK